jgi:predicted ATPase/DNA-binding NarL/FixJ family response regulator
MPSRGPLIGREREVTVVEHQLGSARLLTLTGAGGCGKTRVALEVADRAGAVVVELAAVQTPEQVVDAWLRALALRERAGRTPAETLLESLAGRSLLLVLDNCEHVAAEVALLVTAVLDAAPGVRLLATSREPLGPPGEVVLQLEPLGLPDARGDVAAVVRSAAGRFFVERAAAADPRFALTPDTAPAVTEICRRLGGLPLALELAAARVTNIAPTEIAGGLARHRSLRASLDWSHALLDEPERVLLRRLSAFAGGWTAGAARAVALPAQDEGSVRARLEALARKGLIVTVGPERWSFLPPIAGYAAERLLEAGDADETRARHLEYFRAFAARADARLLDPHGHELIDAETANLRRALERAIERDAAAALALVASLTRHWILAEHFEEGRTALAAALAVGGEGTEPAALALAHCCAGLLGTLSEDYEAAIGHTMTGLALTPAVEDPRAEGQCLQMSSMVLILTGMDLDTGLGSARRAAELLRSSGDLLGVAFALTTVEWAEGLCDRFDAARAAYAELLAIPGAGDHVRLRTWAELAAAWAEVVAGSPADALRHADRALELEGEWPSMTHFIAVSHRVHALARLGRTADALAEGTGALTRATGSGAAMATPAIEMALAIAELAHGDAAAARERARPIAEQPQLHTAAIMRETLARAALAERDVDGARAQAGALAAIAERTGSARQRAVADFARGAAAALADDDDGARELLQSALAAHAHTGFDRGAADVLDELALLAARAGDGPRAARLAAAASAARTRLRCAPAAPADGRLDAARAAVAERDGLQAWETAWAEGAALPLEEVIAYARRSRGPRDRPRQGWGSLTPAEHDVAQLAAKGMSNPQIASQLFMSRGTVKAHLSSVYDKLRITNRTELAHRMATQPESTPSLPGGYSPV